MFTPARKSMPAIDYVSIVRSVYNDRRAMVVGAFACVLCTSVTGYLTGSWLFFIIAAGFVISAIFRFIDMTRFKNADIGPTDVEVAARWEVRATYHAAIFAFLCGMWCFGSLVFVNSPFARCLGIRIGEDDTLVMPFSPKIIGNPVLPAIHGGMTGAFLETTAIVGVTRELGVDAAPKPIGLTINYLRSGRALDSFAKVSIVKQGRRVVAFEAQAWQDDPAKPIASAFGHFMLRTVPGADEEMV